jgi:hypothetical protein
MFIFKTSKNELSNIFDELIEYPVDFLRPIMKIVYDKPYQFLFVNTDTQRLFKCFDEIILDEDGEDD